MIEKKDSQILQSDEVIKQRIFIIRGKKVMIDTDLSELYGVTTKALNQAIKRNLERFPEDFMFKLTEGEKEEVVTICDHLIKLKFSPHLPYAFTEHGVAMLSAVLNSERAIQMSIFVVRAFIKMRESLEANKDLAFKIGEIEINQIHDHAMLKNVHSVVKHLLYPPLKSKGKAGFDTTE